MNWRTIVLRYAANVLDEIGKPELADNLRDVDVPNYDGGGIYLVRYDGTWQHEFVHRTLLHDGLGVGQRAQMAFDIQKEIEDGTIFLVPIYPSAVKSVVRKRCRCA